MNEIQNKVLDIMKYFHKFCVENGVDYFMMSGTLLGAVRHKGFIPWDDDIDVGMTPENYKKFVSLAKAFNDGSENYEIVLPLDKGYCYNFIKVMDKTTTIIDYFKEAKYALGVYIDVFEFVGVDKNSVESIIKKRNIYFWMRTCAFSFRSIMTRRRIPFYFLGKLLGTKRAFKLIKKIDGKFNYYDSSYVYDPDGRNPKGVIPKEYIENGIELMKFEDGEFFGLREYDKYLTSIYGDYMTLPPEDKRKGHIAYYINFNMSYKEFREKGKTIIRELNR